MAVSLPGQPEFDVEIASLSDLNAADEHDFVSVLAWAYGGETWIGEALADGRPFNSLAALKFATVVCVRHAPPERQRALLGAHPELAVTPEQGDGHVQSAAEQRRSGLTDLDDETRNRFFELNHRYRQKFGWPFVLAVGGPRGTGLAPAEIEQTLRRRLSQAPVAEFAESLRQLHRIAELRLQTLLGEDVSQGDLLWDWADDLAAYSEPEFAARGELTVTYLTDAHLACMRHIEQLMREQCGFDDVHVDAVGNVVGVYYGKKRDAPRLLTGSHYDTVRNGGRYDGRLGILAPMLCVRELSRRAERLPIGLEVVAFSEEEGQRFAATFLGSSALLGQFDEANLERRDAEGTSMADAMRSCGFDPAEIPAIARDWSQYLAFVECHIEQGPVLNAMDIPLGVVTSINGAVRMQGTARGVASHAGTTPMTLRSDAALAVAELALFVERRALAGADVVATVGILEVPAGSVNVIPGRCNFSLDIRATTDEARDACLRDVMTEIERIGHERGVAISVEETMRASAAPCDVSLQARWAHAIDALGVPVHRMPSGAGHDAMKMHEALPQAMLFVRGGNDGISHNPLEIITRDDAQHCVDALMQFLRLSAQNAPTPNDD